MLTRRVRRQELSIIRLAYARQARQHARRNKRPDDPDGDDQPAKPNVKACEGLERGCCPRVQLPPAAGRNGVGKGSMAIASTAPRTRMTTTMDRRVNAPCNMSRQSHRW